MLESQGNPNISKATGWPRKCFYRAWTHTNPLIDSHFPVPLSPSQVDNLLHFPQISPSSSENGADTKKIGGIVYTITDAEEQGEWMKTCLKNHPLFEALTEEELEADPVVKLLDSATEEGQKVARNGDTASRTPPVPIGYFMIGKLHETWTNFLWFLELCTWCCLVADW
ncbi:hypothetical protein Ancab_010324 [Ancistrocladus abbreviatus]